MAPALKAALLALALGPLALPAAAREDAATICDNGAGSPQDTDLPDGVEGTAFDDLDPTRELEAACLEAAAFNPTDRRFYTHLGRLYASRGKAARAIDAYRHANARGSAVAANNIAAMYAEGDGVPKDQNRATRFYRKAANRGLVSAMLTMAVRARLGIGTRENMATAFYWYERAHDAGDPVATNDLGVMYAQGYGVRENDVRAARLFEEALDRRSGYAEAASNLADAYLNGAGIEADPIAAREYYILAFEGGDGDAAESIGRLYAEGVLGDPDSQEAVEWYRKGAEAGSIYATVALADAYAEGAGVEADPDRAQTLYREAVAASLGPDAPWRAYAEERLVDLKTAVSVGSEKEDR